MIGLDGVTWDLIRPWVEDGWLPNLGKMILEGTWGDLQSVIPPLTAPAWASFATGKNPGKSGIFDFKLPTENLAKTRCVTTEDIHGVTFYELLSRKKRCILVNLPCSYPPRIPGIVITGLLTRGKNYIFPTVLMEKIPELKKYRIFPATSLLVEGKNREYINDIRALERARFNCAKQLFKESWDFFFILFSGTDWIQHLLYDELISGTFDEESEPIKAFKEIDEYIGFFINNMPSNTTVLIISDHGFRTLQGIFFVNEWLRREGYLKVKTRRLPHKATEESLGMKQKREAIEASKKGKLNIKMPFFLLRYPRLLRIIGYWYDILRGLLPIKILKEFEPDLSKTIAYCTSSIAGSIYINNEKSFDYGTVEAGKDCEKIIGEIMEKLEQLRNPKDGEKILENVWRKEDIYFGERMNGAPDIILMSEKYGFRGALTPRVFVNKRINVHSSKGVFLAYGQSIKIHRNIKNARIIDIAPTILHLMNVPVPSDMDGKVLKEIFRSESDAAKREVEYIKPVKIKMKKIEWSEAEEEEINKRLKALGYLG